MALEKDIQKEICKYLVSRGFLFWRNNNATSFKNRATNKNFTPNGLPDIFIVLDGKLIGLEVKVKDGVLRDSQKAFGDRLTRAGGYYYVVRSIGDVIDILPE